MKQEWNEIEYKIHPTILQTLLTTFDFKMATPVQVSNNVDL